jgi:hypothetical protein
MALTSNPHTLLGVLMLRERMRSGVAKLESKEEDKASMLMLSSLTTTATDTVREGLFLSILRICCY